MKDQAQEYKPVYKRELKRKGDKLVMHNTTFVPISKEFSDAIVKQMKKGNIWEDIVSFDGQDYMEERKYEIYSTLAKLI